MPKYYFRANMCMTFIVECEKNTLISDIKILFGQELKISTNEITMTRMPFKRILSDNDKIGDFPPVERSFIFIKFNAPYTIPDLSQNKMLKLVNPEMHDGNYNIPFEYEDNATPNEYDNKEFTIFSDNYQMHSTIEAKYNYTDNFMLENLSKRFENKYNINPNESNSTQFLSKLIELYQKGDINDLQELLSGKLSDIENEISNSKFPHDNLDDLWPKNKISDLKEKLDKNSNIYNEIVELVQQKSPEAANFLKEKKDEIIKKLVNIDIFDD